MDPDLRKRLNQTIRLTPGPSPLTPLRRALPEPDDQRPTGWPIVAVVACALLLFAFIGWCANISDDVHYLKRRVDQLEEKSR